MGEEDTRRHRTNERRRVVCVCVKDLLCFA